MGRIQSNTGLATGIDIKGTVDQLMQVEGRSRDLLVSRQRDAQSRQTAVNDLTALTIALQVTVKRLGKSELFATRSISSSDNDTLAAAASTIGGAAAGSYSFTPVRLAQTQQAVSRGFESKTNALGLTGTFSVTRGGIVDSPTQLSTLNDGAGVARGRIRVTDRSGATAVIDLSTAKSIDDVLTAINTNDAIRVKASAEGDRIRLTDLSGESSANLRVQEVTGGTTARDLGLDGINTNTASALGADRLRLHTNSSLNSLRDGDGLTLRSGANDLRVQLRDGTSLDIDFKRVAHDAQQATGRSYGENGINADLQFTARATGAANDGVKVRFVSTGAVTAAGSETVAYDTNNKTLTFDIAAGATTADDIVSALANDTTASALFTATKASGSDGSGVITVRDAAKLAGGAAATATNEQSLGDLLATINAADPTRLRAEIGADGDRIVLTDLTTGARSFAVSSAPGGSLAEQLGLAKSTTGGSLSGSRLQSGLKGPLLSSLNGGRGFSALGTLAITDRSGATANVDLSGAETLDDVLLAINASGLGVRASVNANKNGIALTDTTGATTSQLIVANGDGTNTATKLKLAASVSGTSIDTGSLDRRTVGRRTTLAAFNAGEGVALGSFTIKDASGATGAVNLRTRNAQNIGDVIDAINDAGVGVKARLNDTGDGLLLVDTTGQSGTITVADVGSGTAAKSLKIAGTSVSTIVDGESKQAIDGATTGKITISATDSLTKIADKFNGLAGVTAAVTQDPTGETPFRLSITSKTGGEAGRFTFSDGVGLGVAATTVGQDGLTRVGSGATANLISSPTNVLEDVVPGLTITLKNASTTPVTVTVDKNVDTVVSTVKSFVDQFNKLKDKLSTYTSYDASSQKKGSLFGSTEALRVDADLSRLLSSRFNTGSVASLQALGIELTDAGKLTFDESKLRDKYTSDPSSVEKFFTDSTKGFGKKADDLIETLVGKDDGSLITRAKTLQTQVETLSDRISAWGVRLEAKRNRLLLQFYNLELAVSKIQASYNSSVSNLSNAVSNSRST